ncbi:MAG: metallopeptidase family protein [Syntrophales bacterium]|nr:metallopeptidase family protein [Syntrophales bacterium]
MKFRVSEFDRAVKRAIEKLPEEIRAKLTNVIVTVKKRPSKNLLRELGIGKDNVPLGLYVGQPLKEKSFFSLPGLPDRIYIFQEPLERMCDSLSSLEEEIKKTVIHEIAHHLGFTDDELDKLGYS